MIYYDKISITILRDYKVKLKLILIITAFILLIINNIVSARNYDADLKTIGRFEKIMNGDSDINKPERESNVRNVNGSTLINEYTGGFFTFKNSFKANVEDAGKLYKMELLFPEIVFINNFSTVIFITICFILLFSYGIAVPPVKFEKTVKLYNRDFIFSPSLRERISPVFYTNRFGMNLPN